MLDIIEPASHSLSPALCSAHCYYKQMSIQIQPIEPCLPEFLVFCLGPSLYLFVGHLKNMQPYSCVHGIESATEFTSLGKPLSNGGQEQVGNRSLLFCLELTSLKGSLHGSSEDSSGTQPRFVGSQLNNEALRGLSSPPLFHSSQSVSHEYHFMQAFTLGFFFFFFCNTDPN